MSERHAIFVINLQQDVNIVRPLVYMAARDLGMRTAFLVSHLFFERDRLSIWREELNQMREDTGTPIVPYDNPMQARQMLQGKSGVLIAASESELPGHQPVHDLFRQAPSSFVKITLQHGFECIGFLHNRAHDTAHGRQVAFAADIVCGWCDGARLTSMAPSQRPKLYVSGPPAVLQMRPVDGSPRSDLGLVCENLHSVRLTVPGDFKAGFIETFKNFCAALATEGRKVALRPHPGGQYTLKHGVELPRNAVLNNHPIYKVDLAKYAYGISAPSSVLIDFVLAGVPAAVWCDEGGAMDADNYAGLTRISTVRDWIEFSREAIAQPQRFLAQQQRFIERQQMPTDPAEVYRRFAKLLAVRPEARAAARAARGERVLFVANDLVTTLQVSFVKPLRALVRSGQLATELLTEKQMRDELKADLGNERAARDWIDRRIELFRPSIMVFCRYSGPHAQYLVDKARRDGMPVIFHLDDDLLNVPPEVGQKKHQSHNHPARLATVRLLLDQADLVYASTERLRARLRSLGAKAAVVAGKIYCPGQVLSPAVDRPVRKIGCMGVDKGPDLEAVVPAIVAYLRRNPDVSFELFGSMPKPAALDEFAERVRVVPTVRNYDEFLAAFSKLDWDIGICPLLPTPFNMFKANTKWVDYTSVGAAVIASKGTVYDACCADGCGILAETTEEWLAALERLTRDPAERFAQVGRAQKRMMEEYSVEQLRNQVLAIFARARSQRRDAERAAKPAPTTV